MLLRLLRTVAHLKPVQVYGRAVFKLHQPKLRLLAVPPRRSMPGRWARPIAKAPSLVGSHRAVFLNIEADIGTADAWTDPIRDKLWLYNLHYFDDLNAAEAASRGAWHRALVGRWITENPPGQGDGWDPYPISLRIVNWIKWAMAGAVFDQPWLDSLAVQTRWLEQRIEWHLLGNHLLANAKALIFSGLFFEGAESNRWLAKGLAIYRRQLGEQVLVDGGHFERSPMYQAIILEDLLDLLNIAGCAGLPDTAVTAALIPDWRRISTLMLGWLQVMTHPDGGISFFNDAAFGIAPTTAQLGAYAMRLGVELPARPMDVLINLGPSGYLRATLADAVCLIDAAPIGPDYLPGHAHADTLSFELSVGDERIIVNGGVSVYGVGPQRQLERSTAAHSTVELAGGNSSEVWSGFRVGRRARVRGLTAFQNEDQITVSAEHDGYRWLPGRPNHWRGWVMTPEGLTITDRVDADTSPAIARFHLGPGILVEFGADARVGVLATPSGRRIGWRTSSPAKAESSAWRPEFGMSIVTQCLVVGFESQSAELQLTWSPLCTSFF